ncbi:MAG: 30S ribosomal protein S15 [Candidatus Diapherotrites archaeon]|nr:30S ribosomal protein S15 [Candidatus Diapherotrites archaeon]
MARMHSGSKGKSRSKKPPSKIPPTWVEYKPKQIEELVVKLANEGNSPADIGRILRDLYGIPSVKIITGKKIEKILKENKISSEIPHDLLNLIKKAAKLEKHLKTNKKDFTAKRGLQLTVSKIRRLQNYYLKEGKLPKNWRYSSEVGALLVK